MGGGQLYPRRDTIIEGFLPARGTETPAVARIESRKPIAWVGRTEVIPLSFAIDQEFCRHFSTDNMRALIIGSSFAAAVPVKPGHGSRRTGG